MKFNFAYTALVTVIMTIISRFDGVAASSAASSSSGLDEIDPPQTRKTRSLTSKKNGSGYGSTSCSGCTAAGGDAYNNSCSPPEKLKCCDGSAIKKKKCRDGADCYYCREGAGPTPSPSPDAPCEAVCVATQVEFTDETNHTKYACGDPTYTEKENTWVCYPTKGHPKKHIPVVFFNRDSNGWLDPSGTYKDNPGRYKNKIDAGNKRWLRTMAEQCLITVAPMTKQTATKGSTEYSLCKQNYDSLLAYEFLKYNGGWETWDLTKDVQPELTRIAAAGLSSGAHHAPSFQMLMGDTHDITMKAVLIGHGGSLDTKKESDDKGWGYKGDLDTCLKGKWCDNVPAMFLTATNDSQVNYKRTYNWYKKLTGQNPSPYNRARVQNAVYAQAKLGEHLEPTVGDGTVAHTGIFNAYSARFLACYLYKDDTNAPLVSPKACAWIYGGLGKKNICDSPKVKALALDKVALFYNGEKICDKNL